MGEEVQLLLAGGGEGMSASIPNRDQQHGGMEPVGEVSQRIKAAMRDSRNWPLLTCGQQEALDMAAHKIARILSGDNAQDPEHWTDLAGYPIAAMRAIGVEVVR